MFDILGTFLIFGFMIFPRGCFGSIFKAQNFFLSKIDINPTKRCGISWRLRKSHREPHQTSKKVSFLQKTDPTEKNKFLINFSKDLPKFNSPTPKYGESHGGLDFPGPGPLKNPTGTKNREKPKNKKSIFPRIFGGPYF